MLAVFNPPKFKGSSFTDHFMRLPYEQQIELRDKAPKWLHEYYNRLIRESQSGTKKNPVKRYGSRALYKHERLRSPKGLHHFRTVSLAGGHRIIIGCPVKTHKGRCPVGTVAQALLHPKQEKNPPAKGKIFSNNVEKIYYIHAENGKPYVHKFKRGVRMEALNDGSVRLSHPSKDGIWTDI